MNISLTKHFDEFVQRQVESGRYNNSSEVIRAALRLLEDHDAMTHAKMRAAVDRGLADVKAGRVSPFDPGEIKREGRKRLAAKNNS